MGDPTDQVGTIDTTGLSGGVPNLDDIMVAPELLEPVEEGEEEAAQEARQAVDEGDVAPEDAPPTSLAESKELEEEEAEEATGDGDEDTEEIEPEEEIPAPGETPPEPTQLPAEQPEATQPIYDPGEHSVAEVQSYVQNHPEERDAIIKAEKKGKERKGILDL
jgi:hypothetical protein